MHHAKGAKPGDARRCRTKRWLKQHQHTPSNSTLLPPYAGAPGRPLGLLPRAAAAACLLLAILRATIRSASSCCWYHLRFWLSFSSACRCTSSLK